ncbi:MAG TPA: hypothetical protein VGL40_02585 [Bacillota bacterium]|jgi:hypothetical protein
MRHTTVITAINLRGIVEGLAELILPDQIPPRTLFALVNPPESALVTGDDEVRAHFQVGKPVVRELWLQRAEPWARGTDGRRSLRQAGGAGTAAEGVVVQVTGPRTFCLDGDPGISVECHGQPPRLGQWVRVRGTLLCLNEQGGFQTGRD